MLGIAHSRFGASWLARREVNREVGKFARRKNMSPIHQATLIPFVVVGAFAALVAVVRAAWRRCGLQSPYGLCPCCEEDTLLAEVQPTEMMTETRTRETGFYGDPPRGFTADSWQCELEAATAALEAAQGDALPVVQGLSPGDDGYRDKFVRGGL